MPFALCCACFGRKGGGKKSSSKKKKVRANQVTPSQQIKLDNLEKVLKELECPICLQTCISPVYSCTAGHIVCNKCRKNVTQCPICRGGFTTIRNRFVEHFIDQYSQNCRFSKEGCKFLRWKGDDMHPHEASCPYRKLKCASPSCQLTISYRSLLEHLIEIHHISGSKELPVNIHYVMEEIVTDRKWKPYYITAFGCTFYVMLEIARPFFWAWIWVQCPKAELTERYNFNATLKFTSSKMALDWKGPVYPIRIPGEFIIRDGICFGGPDSLIQHFNEDGEMILNVDIQKVPGGFDDGNVSDDGTDVLLHPSDSEILATGDADLVQRFSQMLNSASNPLIRRGASLDLRNNNQRDNQPENGHDPTRTACSRKSSAKSKKSRSD